MKRFTLFCLLICLQAIPLFSQTEILLIRHGETDWNVENRLQGHIDNPLNAKGLAQALILAEKLLAFHPDILPIIYSSDLQRALHTAEKTAQLFCAESPLPIIQSQDLREFCWGVIDGMLAQDRDDKYKEYNDEICRKYPDRKERWDQPLVPEEGVESLNHLLNRTRSILKTIAQNHPNEKVAVFTSGRLINTLIIEAQDINADILGPLPNCAVVHFLFEPNGSFQFVKITDLLKENKD